MARPHHGSESCPHCGASTLEHCHTMSSGLASALVAFADAGKGSHNLKDLDLNRNQWDNFQKLKYWILVKSIGNGVWEMTLEGWAFINGGCIRAKVWTYRGEVIEYEGGELTLREALGTDPTFQHRGEYADRKPLVKENTLF